MKTTEVLYISTAKRTQFVSITSKIYEVVASKGFKDGVLTIFVPHTTPSGKSTSPFPDCLVYPT